MLNNGCRRKPHPEKVNEYAHSVGLHGTTFRSITTKPCGHTIPRKGQRHSFVNHLPKHPQKVRSESWMRPKTLAPKGRIRWKPGQPKKPHEHELWWPLDPRQPADTAFASREVVSTARTSLRGLTIPSADKSTAGNKPHGLEAFHL